MKTEKAEKLREKLNYTSMGMCLCGIGPDQKAQAQKCARCEEIEYLLEQILAEERNELTD